jgi:predicted dienelactone hydrolase
MKRWLLSLLAALAAACAQAGVGLTELPGLQGDGPVTVFYPSSAADQALQRGPYTLQVANNGPAMRGNSRLIVMSHGSGGAPWVHSDLARKLVDAGFVVAFPEHRGDDWKSMSDAGPVSWRRRPEEVSRAIDAVLGDGRFAPLVQSDRVGMYGMSAGGHTALVMAGGRWSPAALRQHCEEHLAEDFSSCVGLATQLRGNFLDGLRKAIAIRVIRSRLDDATWYSHAEPRVTAVVADVPTAGHGSLMSPPPRANLPRIAADLLSDPPGFDRTLVPAVHDRIVAFFRQTLLP